MAGQTRVTLSDVAAAAGVSRMTASYTYNQPSRVAAATRERVLDAAARLGFLGPDPSGRFLRQGSLRSLGLVLGESLSYVFDDPQATRFVAGLADVCTASGYALTIIPTTGGPEDTGRVSAAAVDAFVVWTTTADDPVLDAVRATHRRAVIHGGPPADGFTLVSIDNRAAARALAADVWDTSSAAPAVLSFPTDRARRAGVHHGLDPSQARYPVTRDRLAGFRDAANDLGLDWSTVPVVVCALNRTRDARDATATLLGGAHVDGLVAMSDQLALGALDALRSAGLDVPDDVTLGGFDDSPQAAATELTSVHQSLHDQGVRAARLALGVDDPAAGAPAPWQLRHRRSTARPKPGGG